MQVESKEVGSMVEEMVRRQQLVVSSMGVVVGVHSKGLGRPEAGQLGRLVVVVLVVEASSSASFLSSFPYADPLPVSGRWG